MIATDLIYKETVLVNVDLWIGESADGGFWAFIQFPNGKLEWKYHTNRDEAIRWCNQYTVIVP